MNPRTASDFPQNRADWHDETRVLHGDAGLSPDAALVPPIHYSATFKASDAQAFAEMANTPRHSGFYTRYGNPTHEHAAALLAQLEGTETALLTASGMAAISTTVLALIGVEVSIIEQSDVEAFRQALRPNTKLIMVESPVNPTLVLTDLAAVAALARPRGILTLADNTFASPLNQRPHALGIDIVLHSATKYMGGHHDLTAGAVCCSAELAEKIWRMHVTLGAVLSPMDAWLLLRGLRTLPLRIERINANALALAEWLERQPQVERVHYPGLESHPQHALAKRQMRGFGAVIAFAVRGGFDATSRFVASLDLATHAVSLGGVDSLIVHTAAMWAGTMNEAQMVAAGIAPNFVRMSRSEEHTSELQADMARALQQL